MSLAPTAQVEWAALSVKARLQVLRRARHLLARMTRDLAEAIPPTLSRSAADTRAAEILPLLAAGKFLEQNAARILVPRHLGRRGLPFWLAGIESEIERAPFGRVLVIGPSNYPLFLPGVQVLQALCAGNAVVWKPGLGGRAVAEVFAAAFEHAGLPEGLLRVTDDSVSAGLEEIALNPDKIFFTGSAEAGRAILQAAAETATPVVAELSGCDAVFVLPSADVARVVEALVFGMRLNGSATCMAPRRLVLVGTGHLPLITALKERFAAMDGIFLGDRSRELLKELADDAVAQGGVLCGDVHNVWAKPLLILNGNDRMRSTREDIFAPVLTVIEVPDTVSALSVEQACPYGLTTSIFGDETQARALGAGMQVGTVLINDLIVPTADPRVPFSGRRGSGFGATRGAEGLLEMTAVKTILVRRDRSTRHYQPTGRAHQALFDAVIDAGHSESWRERWQGMRRIFAAARKLK